MYRIKYKAKYLLSPHTLDTADINEAYRYYAKKAKDPRLEYITMYKNSVKINEKINTR